VVVLDSVITHTNAWFLDREIHQLVKNKPIKISPSVSVQDSRCFIMAVEWVAVHASVCMLHDSSGLLSY